MWLLRYKRVRVVSYIRMVTAIFGCYSTQPSIAIIIIIIIIIIVIIISISIIIVIINAEQDEGYMCVGMWQYSKLTSMTEASPLLVRHTGMDIVGAQPADRQFCFGGCHQAPSMQSPGIGHEDMNALRMNYAR